MFQVKNLKVNFGDKRILFGVDLQVNKGETTALMGKNGSGKSTLAQVIMGHPTYDVVEGIVLLDDKNILNLDVTQRANSGIFLSFQYPSEITGVNVASYLRMIHNKKHSRALSPVKFREYLKDKLERLHIKEDFLDRYLNEGFSGGEKKRMEMLQMLVLEPRLAILDEVDSGLDIDAIKLVASTVNYLKDTTDMSILIITHYARILNYIKPNTVLIMENGRIVKTGDITLAHAIEEHGYANISIGKPVATSQ